MAVKKAPTKVASPGLQPHDLLSPADSEAFATLSGAIDAGLRAQAGERPGYMNPYRHNVGDVLDAGFDRNDLLTAAMSRYVGWDVSWGLDDPRTLVFKVREEKRR